MFQVCLMNANVIHIDKFITPVDLLLHCKFKEVTSYFQKQKGN